MFNSSTFRNFILKYAGIDFDTGDVTVRNRLTVDGNTSSIANYTGLPAVSFSDVNGNLMGNFVDVSGNITTGYFFGDGSQIIGINNGPLPNVITADIQGNLTGTTANITGTASTSSFFLGNGTFISNVVTVLPRSANADILRGNVSAAGNVDTSNATARILRVSGSTFVTGQVNVIGNVATNYMLGNGALLTGVTSDLPDSANIDIIGNVVATNVTAANITTHILRVNGNTSVAGQVNAVGNVSASHLSGNGSFLTGVFTGNLSRDITGNVTAAGNITAGLFVGGGTFLTLNGSTIQPQGNVLNQAERLALNASIGTIVTQEDVNRQFMLTSLPPSSNSNWLQFSGSNFPVQSLFGRLGDVVLISGTDIQSIQGQSIAGSGDITNANIDIRGNVISPNIVNVTNVSTNTLTTGNITVTGQVNVSGNTSALYYFGNASGITNAAYLLPSRGNVDIRGNVNATGNVDAANISSTNGTVNGNLFVSGQVTVSGGNVVANYLSGDASRLQGVLPTFTERSAINIVGNVSAPGNVDAMNVVTNILRVSGNANILGQVNATSNVSANYFIGNGSLLTGVNSVLTNGQVINIIGNVRSFGNVDASNVTANILRISGNTFVTGQVNVTGNVIAPFFFGNGFFLTGVNSNLSASQVMNIVGNVSSPANVNASNVNVNTLRINGNTFVNGQVNVIGNIVANVFVGIGSALTGVSATVTGGQTINVFGNVVAPANVNATNVVTNILRVTGNVFFGGQVNIAGNVVANTFIGNGSSLSSVNISGTQNVNITGNVVSSGNVDASNVSTSSMIVRGNAVLGALNITGNLNAAFFIGDGSRITNIPACTAPTSICFVQPSSGFTSNTFCLDYAPYTGWSFVLPSNGTPSTIGIQTFSLPLDPSRPFSNLPSTVNQSVTTPWLFSNGIWTSNVTLTSNAQFGPISFNMGFSNFFGRYLGNSSNTVISSIDVPNQLGFTNIDNTIPINLIAEYIDPTTGNISLCFQGKGQSFLGRVWEPQMIFYALTDKNFTSLLGWNRITYSTAQSLITSNVAQSTRTNSGYFANANNLYFSFINSNISNVLAIYNSNLSTSNVILSPYTALVDPVAQVASWCSRVQVTRGNVLPDVRLSLSPDGSKVFNTFQYSFATNANTTAQLMNVELFNTTAGYTGDIVMSANVSPTGPLLNHGIALGYWSANGMPIENSLCDVYPNVSLVTNLPLSIQTYSDAWSQDSNTAYYTVGSFEPANVGYIWRSFNGQSSGTWTTRANISTGSNAQFNNQAFSMLRVPFNDGGNWVANAIAVGNAFTPSYFIRPGSLSYSTDGNLWFAASIYKNTVYTGNSRFTFAGNTITTPTLNTSGLGFIGLWKIQDSNGSYSSSTLLSSTSETANASKYAACTTIQSISIGRNQAKGNGVMQISMISNISNISFTTPLGVVGCGGLTNPSNVRLTGFDIYPNLFIDGFNAISNVLIANACNGERIQFGNAIDYNYSLTPLLTTHAKLNIDNLV
ncbi:Chlorovirus glycoprotein repeat domain-containing protein [Paramecium bursaria Chlorella virus IL3A]|uniref:Chlorovirus glycoprotein repeat domain-containing protein n=1 Tax=Paramecium bursaria Chlorella virus IL3A TaxID=46019 RepID=M1HVI3_PBCVI|nr:Chlorovirus glycoprotein repeat domain-containing protein [Paramecium bursaria Chlorella virus IL3A]